LIVPQWPLVVIGDHAPVSVELGRSCGRSRSDDCESGRQSEGAHTIANHASPHNCSVLSPPSVTPELLRSEDQFNLSLDPETALNPAKSG
jgi:hypothetical protein